MLIQRHSEQVQSINGLCISKGTKVGRHSRATVRHSLPGRRGRRQSSGSRIVSNIWPPRYYYVALGQITDFCPSLGSSEEFQIFSCQLKMKKLSPNRRALLANYRWELLRNEGGLGGWEIRFDLCEDLV